LVGGECFANISNGEEYGMCLSGWGRGGSTSGREGLTHKKNQRFEKKTGAKQSKVGKYSVGASQAFPAKCPPEKVFTETK